MIVGSLGSGGCGGTFFDWTLHYLAGDSEHWTMQCDLNKREPNPEFLTATDAWARFASRNPVPDTPMLNNTAHGHKKTHPTQHTLSRVLEEFAKHNQDPLQTFYYFDNLEINQLQTIHNYIIKKYPEVKFIPFTFDSHARDVVFCMQLEKLPLIMDFYADSLRQQLPDRDPWTLREIFSLAYPKMLHGQTTAEVIYPHPNSHSIKFTDFFYQLPDHIVAIFDFLGLTIDQSRWANWLDVYHCYQKNNSIEFFQDLDKIVESIVNNYSLDLTKYNMTFAKEVVIAKELLYNYNYTLKAHGLDRIDTNTQAWHSILEPNSYHKIEKDIV